MKKGLLLGLLVLSSMAMAAESSTTTIDIQTQLKIEDTGIIVTPGDDGTEGDALVLDHGTPDKTGDSTAIGPKPVVIKTASGPLPAGRKLKLDLDASKASANDLVVDGGKTSIERIAHTLTGLIEDATIENGKNSLTIAGGNTNDTGTVTTNGNSVKVNFKSTVQKDELLGKAIGNYANTSTLSVTVLAN
ncbi:MAG: hypothetical protein ACRC8M_08630 [Cetobacterium sp.]|uniref:hypothetical protein n=1 Tax=Cetobacterium sp. TaxID=2071632 RepID=UPI003F3D1F2C